MKNLLDANCLGRFFAVVWRMVLLVTVIAFSSSGLPVSANAQFEGNAQFDGGGLIGIDPELSVEPGYNPGGTTSPPTGPGTSGIEGDETTGSWFKETGSVVYYCQLIGDKLIRIPKDISESDCTSFGGQIFPLTTD